ncbi:MAG TPA: YfiR family protein [Verrucomicrobiae bacterium]
MSRPSSKCSLVVLCLLALLPLYALGQSKEYQIKAAFLLNFTKFVDWEPEAFSSEGDPFRIGILGEDPFGQVLEATTQGETVKNRKIQVKRAKKVEDLKDCQMLFISKSEKNNVFKAVADAATRPILVVGETDGFCTGGGHIGFYPEKTKIRFEINPAAAQRCGLKIRSDLLSLGKIVEGKGGK